MVRATANLVALLCSSCTLLPDGIPLEASHLSHITQHFDGSGENRGAQTIGAGLAWHRRGWNIEVLDSWTSGIDGRHEVFQLRVGTEISLHPAYRDPWSHDDE